MTRLGADFFQLFPNFQWRYRHVLESLLRGETGHRVTDRDRGIISEFLRTLDFWIVTGKQLKIRK